MKKGILLLLSIAFLSAPLSSCDLIFGATESYMIEDVTSAIDNEGNTVVTISFRDDARPDFTFTVPTGEDGESGATIKDVTAVPEGEEIVLTITYTDENKEPTILRVPNRKGEDGRLITGLDVGRDGEGNTTLVFHYSDGTESAILTLPKGKDGQDATHLIDSIATEETEEGTQIVIHYADGSTNDVLLVPDGMDGATIEKVEITSVTNTEITYTFYLTDGKEVDVNLPATSSQDWHRGIGKPSPSLGNVGDFFLDIRSGDFYAKENSGWHFLLTIDGYGEEINPNYYPVTFDSQGGTLSTGSSTITYILEEGSRLPLSVLEDTIGIPTRGEDIFLGWFTSPTYNPNAGRFADTTPILRNLTLYAWYDMN